MHDHASTGGPRAQEQVALLLVPTGELAGADLRLPRVKPAPGRARGFGIGISPHNRRAARQS